MSEIRILIAGDFCPRLRCESIIEKMQVENFATVSNIIKGHDYSILNLECPLLKTEANPIKKIGSLLKSSENAIKLIKSIGFKCVTLANNHIYDYGDDGVINTLDLCNKYSIDTVGAGNNKVSAKQILYKNIENRNIAFINICEHEFSVADEIHCGANPINIINNYYDIQNAKIDADFVIVIVHGGHEHYNLPSPRMQDLYRFYIDAGADAVINHHQHCYSGYEYYKGKPISYGLGNFYFDKKTDRNTIWNKGYMLSLSIDKNIKISLIPYLQCGEKPSVELIENNEIDEFNTNIEVLNNIIKDRNKLETCFDNFCKSKEKLYLSVLEPYPTIYLKYLYRIFRLPSLLKGKSFLFVKNFILCESHLDVIMNILKKKL